MIRAELRRRCLSIAQIGFGVLLMLVLVRSADWSQARQAWLTAELGWWVPAMLLLIGYVAFGWHSIAVLIRNIDQSHWREGLIDYGACQAFSLFTPGRVGELALPLILRRSTACGGEIAAILVIQRLINLLLMVALLLATSHTWLDGDAMWLGVAATLAFCALVYYLLTYTTILHRIEALLPLARQGFVRDFDQAWKGVYEGRRRALALHTVINLMRQLSLTLASYLLALSLGVEIPFDTYLGIVAVMSLAGLLPLTIWGLGIAEGVLIMGLGQFGVAAGVALSIALLGRALYLLSMAGWTAIYLARRALQHRHDGAA